MIAKEGKLELKFTPANGEPTNLEVFNFQNGGGVGLAMYNTDEVYQLFLSLLFLPLRKLVIFKTQFFLHF